MSRPPSTSHRLPAFVFACDQGAFTIAALSLLERLVVALHRGGAGPITIVSRTTIPEFKRAKTWDIPIEVIPAMPPSVGPVLVTPGNVLVQPADVRECIRQNGRLFAGEKPLPFGVVADPGNCSKMDEMDFAGSTAVVAQGVTWLVNTKEDAREAQRALWASMTSASDGVVDRVFNRPAGRFLSKLLIHTPVSPNMVSVASILVGVLAAVFLADGSYGLALAGAILFQLSAIVDCVDGDIARMVFKESALGKWLDLAGDQIVHISVFAGIAVGVLREGGDKEILWLGLSAIVGALISFAVVVRGMRQPAAPGGTLQKLIEAGTNRDFSVIVLILAIFQQLPWFVWLAGIGSHLFWMAALTLQVAPRGALATK